MRAEVRKLEPGSLHTVDLRYVDEFEHRLESAREITVGQTTGGMLYPHEG